MNTVHGRTVFMLPQSAQGSQRGVVTMFNSKLLLITNYPLFIIHYSLNLLLPAYFNRNIGVAVAVPVLLTRLFVMFYRLYHRFYLYPLLIGIPLSGERFR